MTDSMEMPDVQERPREAAESSEAKVDLDRPTFAPEEAKELNSNIAEAEAIETALKETVGDVNPQGTDSPMSGAGGIPPTPGLASDTSSGEGSDGRARSGMPQGNYIPTFNTNSQVVRDSIAGQTGSVEGAIDSLETARDTLEAAAEARDGSSEGQPGAERAARADYAADPEANTLDGTAVDLADSVDPEQENFPMETEEAWSEVDDAFQAIDSRDGAGDSNRTGKASFGDPNADPGQSYSAVEMAQGEVLEDSDWNEGPLGGEEPEDPIPAGADFSTGGVNELKTLLAPFKNNLGQLREFVSDSQSRLDEGSSSVTITLGDGQVTIGSAQPGSVVDSGLAESSEGTLAGVNPEDVLEAFTKLDAADPEAEAGGLDDLAGDLESEAVPAAESELEARLENLEETIEIVQDNIAALQDFIEHNPSNHPGQVTYQAVSQDADGYYHALTMTMPANNQIATSVLTQMQVLLAQLLAQLSVEQGTSAGADGAGGLERHSAEDSLQASSQSGHGENWQEIAQDGAIENPREASGTVLVNFGQGGSDSGSGSEGASSQ